MPAPHAQPSCMCPLPGAQPQAARQLRLKGDKENTTGGDVLLSGAEPFESKDINSKQKHIPQP